MLTTESPAFIRFSKKMPFAESVGRVTVHLKNPLQRHGFLQYFCFRFVIIQYTGRSGVKSREKRGPRRDRNGVLTISPVENDSRARHAVQIWRDGVRMAGPSEYICIVLVAEEQNDVGLTLLRTDADRQTEQCGCTNMWGIMCHRFLSLFDSLLNTPEIMVWFRPHRKLDRSSLHDCAVFQPRPVLFNAVDCHFLNVFILLRIIDRLDDKFLATRQGDSHAVEQRASYGIDAVGRSEDVDSQRRIHRVESHRRKYVPRRHLAAVFVARQAVRRIEV